MYIIIKTKTKECGLKLSSIKSWSYSEEDKELKIGLFDNIKDYNYTSVNSESFKFFEDQIIAYNKTCFK